MAKVSRKDARTKRHRRLRKKISGTAARPRLAVFTSEKHVYAQLIDDEAGRTLAQASTVSDKENKGNMEGAAAIGKLVAERGIEAGVKEAVYDRGGFTFHGRVKAVAEAAREAGLKI